MVFKAFKLEWDGWLNVGTSWLRNNRAAFWRKPMQNVERTFHGRLVCICKNSREKFFFRFRMEYMKTDYVNAEL